MFNIKFRKNKQLNSTKQSSKTDEPHKEETRTYLKLHNNQDSYEKEIEKQKAHMNKEIANVNEMFKDGSISADIHERYLKLLEIGYAQKIQETRVKFGFELSI